MREYTMYMYEFQILYGKCNAVYSVFDAILLHIRNDRNISESQGT